MGEAREMMAAHLEVDARKRLASYITATSVVQCGSLQMSCDQTFLPGPEAYSYQRDV